MIRPGYCKDAISHLVRCGYFQVGEGVLDQRFSSIDRTRRLGTFAADA